MFAVQAEGKDITTIEGIGEPDALHPLQEAFREHHGLQCGYCTPGMITRAKKLLEEIPNPTEEEIIQRMTKQKSRTGGTVKWRAKLFIWCAGN